MAAFSAGEEVIRPSRASRLFVLLWPALILLLGVALCFGVRLSEPGDGLKIMLCTGLVAAGLCWAGLGMSIRLTADAVDYRWRGWPMIVEFHIRFADVTKVRRVQALPVSLFDGTNYCLEVSFIDSGRRRKVTIALGHFSSPDVRKIVTAFETACPRHCAWMKSASAHDT